MSELVFIFLSLILFIFIFINQDVIGLPCVEYYHSCYNALNKSTNEVFEVCNGDYSLVMPKYCNLTLKEIWGLK